MAWSGYGLYDGDGTQTCHYDFIQWAKIEENDEVISSWLSNNKTSIPKEKRQMLGENAHLIIKKMPKLPIHLSNLEHEDTAIEWQMLLSLFLDNKIQPPDTVIKEGLRANQFLMGEHASEFDEPSKRRTVLKRFEKRVRYFTK